METNSLEDITIENMLANIFTNTTVKKSRKDIVSYYRQNLMGGNLFCIPDGELEKRIDKVLKEDLRFYGIIGQSTSDWISLSIEYDRGSAYAINGSKRREISSKINNFDL